DRHRSPAPRAHSRGRVCVADDQTPANTRLFLISVEAIFVFGGVAQPTDVGVAKTLVDNFTSLFGVVIASYFGAEVAKHTIGTPTERAGNRVAGGAAGVTPAVAPPAPPSSLGGSAVRSSSTAL